MKLGTSELIIILLIILVLFGTTLIPRLKKMIQQSKKNYREGLHDQQD